MKKKIFVTREVFGEVLDFLAPHFEVASNQEDRLTETSVETPCFRIVTP